ncbi:MAG: hypothetical protein PHR39_09545 [Actinomycetota bacterium]|nr:hypothetical protein [Actinomycetota bacterium]
MDEIIKILKKYGPLTGKGLKEKANCDSLKLWRFCNTSDQIIIKTIGKKYLRLDRHIDGYARLSPSILREFLTYSIIALKENDENIDETAKGLSIKIREISKNKLELAKTIVKQLTGLHKNYNEIRNKAVFVIAGDIVHRMAHSEIRPEPSTGEIINGSDLDIIIVTKHLCPRIVKELDNKIYSQKCLLIKNPAYHEEIDYIIKDISKVKKQLSVNDFESMVASKILDEGKYLYGSKILFSEIKKMLLDNDISQKFAELEKKAISERRKARKYLLRTDSFISNDEYDRLFFTKEESDEIF